MDNFVIASLNFGGQTDSMDFEKTDQWHKLLELTYAAWRVADITIENEFLKSKVKQTAAEILVEYPNALGDRKKMEDLSSRIRSQRALLSLAQKTSNSRELNFTILKNEYYKINIVVAQLMPPSAPAEHHQYQQKKEAPFSREAEPRRQASVENVKEVIQQKQQEKESDGASEPKQNIQTEILSVERVRSAPAERVEAPRAERIEALTDRQKKIFQFFSKRRGDKIRLKEIAQVFPDLTDRTVRNDLRDLCTKKYIVRSEGHGQASFYKLGNKEAEA